MASASAPFMTLGHSDSVLTVVVVESAPPCIVTGCQDHAIRVWDGATWSCLQTLYGHRRPVLALASLHRWLFSGSSDTCVRVHTRALGRSSGGRVAAGVFSSVAELKLHAGAIHSLAAVDMESLHQGGDTAAAGGAGAHISVFAGCQDTNVYRLDVRVEDTPRGAHSRVTVTACVQYCGHQGFVYSVLLRQPPSVHAAASDAGSSASECMLLAGSGDGCIRVWAAFAPHELHEAPDACDSTAGFVIGADEEERAHPTGLAPALNEYDSDGVALVVVGEHSATRDAMHVFHAPSPHDVTRQRSNHHAALDFNHAAHTSAALPGACGGVYSLAMHGRDLFAGAQDGSIRVWDADTRHMKYVLTGHTGEVLALCIGADPSPPPAPSGATSFTEPLPTPLAAGMVRTCGSMGVFGDGGFHASASTLGWTRAPALLCSGGADKTIRIWSTRTYICTRVLSPGGGIVLGLACSPHTLFAASSDAAVRIFDTASLIRAHHTSDARLGGIAASTSDAGLPAARTDGVPTADVRTHDERVWVNDGLQPQAVARAMVAGASPQGMLTCLRDLVAIPSVSLNETPGAHTRDVNACWRAARFVHDMLLAIGGECRLVQGAAGCNPMVLARVGGWDARTPTIAIHAHYDVQPAGDDGQWESPPFALSGRDGYVYGRGASDNKGPLIALIHAVARFCEGRTISTHKPAAFVFALEGEGENGSLGFREAILQNVEWFAHTSLILNCNNTWIGETAPCLTYGLRGLVKLRLDVEGAHTDLHSGLDGGVCHEPLQDICAVIASLVDPATGRIAVPGMYDMVAPLSHPELALYRGLDFDVDAFMTARGLAGVYNGTNVRVNTPEHGPYSADPTPQPTVSTNSTPSLPPPACAEMAHMGKRARTVSMSEADAAGSSRKRVAAAASADAEASALHADAHVSCGHDHHVGRGHVSAADDVASAVLLRRWREPSLSVHGITCTAANDSIIPRMATAFISVRTVPSMTSAHTFDALAAHMQRVFAARGSVHTLRVRMTSHAAWWLQSPTAPHYQAAARAVERHWGCAPIFVREGGTVRVTTFLEKTLHAPALHLPLGQSSDATHLPNERIRVSNLTTGVCVLEALFHEVAAGALQVDPADAVEMSAATEPPVAPSRSS